MPWRRRVNHRPSERIASWERRPEAYDRFMIADEYGSTFPAVHSFIEMVRGVIRSADSASDAVQRNRPRFAHQLADPGWLPPEYQEPAPRVGWGVAPVNGCFTAPATAHSRYSASSFLLTRRHRRTTTLHGPWSAFTEARRMRRFSPTKAGVLRLSRRRIVRPGGHLRADPAAR